MESEDAAPRLCVPAPQPATQSAGPAAGQGGLSQQGAGGKVPQVPVKFTYHSLLYEEIL